MQSYYFAIVGYFAMLNAKLLFPVSCAQKLFDTLYMVGWKKEMYSLGNGN